ncbi:MAG TPA: adenylate/guanylate cyclase domain-containing protein, partial [Mycobacterium sp.]|nr:adenylate/guanylate cyclase domain-containing protein [Mycobacterium sp.]
MEYAVDLALSYIIAVVDAAAILIPLRGHTLLPTDVDFAEKNTTTIVVLVALGIVGVAVAG